MPNVFDQLDDRQFTLAVTRLADSLSYGGDSSPYRGSGIDYVQSRLYSPGDPVKAIDWRVTARSGKVHVKEFESLKHVPVMVVIDQSASMGVTSVARSKWEWAVMLAAALALAAINRSSPVGVIGTAGDEQSGLRVAPSLAREKVYAWTARLRRQTPADRRAGQLTHALHELEATLHERGLLLVLSDLHEPQAIAPLKRLAQRHEVIALRLRDPAETASPMRGIFRGVEAETGARFTALGRRGVDASGASDEVNTAGIRRIMLDTATEFVPALRAFLANRSLVARSGR